MTQLPEREHCRNDAEVEKLVRAAPRTKTLPTDLTPSLALTAFDFGAPPAPCWIGFAQWRVPACVFGDPKGGHTMVIYGDSHAGQWFTALDLAAVPNTGGCSTSEGRLPGERPSVSQ